MPNTSTANPRYQDVLEQVKGILENFSKWNCPNPSFVKSMLTENPSTNDREIIAELHAAMAQPTVNKQYAAIYNALANAKDVSKRMFEILSKSHIVTGTASAPLVNPKIFPPELQTDSKNNPTISTQAHGG